MSLNAKIPFSFQDEQFLGFGSDEEVKVRSPTKSPTGTSELRDCLLLTCNGVLMPPAMYVAEAFSYCRITERLLLRVVCLPNVCS